MSNTIISSALVAHIAQLANLPVSSQQQQAFAEAFSQTIEEVEKIFQVDVQDVEPTHHVTGLVNIWRADEVDSERMLPQELAISQADHILNGYIVVDRIIEE